MKKPERRKVKLKEPRYTIAELFKEIRRACQLKTGLECASCPVKEGETCGLKKRPDFYDLRKMVPAINKLMSDGLT